MGKYTGSCLSMKATLRESGYLVEKQRRFRRNHHGTNVQREDVAEGDQIGFHPTQDFDAESLKRERQAG